MSIPRLELTAATLSVKIGLMIEDALEYSSLKQYYWIDSKVVLGYIQNDTKRFKVFVANRVAQIRDHSEASQWRYICSKQNPADTASRGIDPSKFIKSLWFSGPDFLWDAKVNMDHPEHFHVDENDVELRRNVSVFSTEISSKMEICERFSNWMKLKKVITYVLMFIAKTKIKRRNRHQMPLRSNVLSQPEISVSDLVITEYKIISIVQRSYFSKELLMLQNNECVNDSSRLSRLDAFIDENGIIRVGGRLRKSTLPYKEKHPIVLPKEAFVSKLVVRWCHEKTMKEVRTNGYWIVNLNSVVRKLIWSCVSCKKLRSQCGSQKMADLPVHRMLTDPPFSYCGLDLFGPFEIKERRSLVKRYGVIFTCLSCRGVHLETTNSLDTDSFILALRRFIARRGNVRMIRSDNGTNIIGAKNELSIEFVKMDQGKIKRFLLDNNTDWIEWKTNPPRASHMGGVWERQIRTARSILANLLMVHGHSLNDESFRTILTEVEATINCRPLSVENLNDPTTPTPISPYNLLTMKSKIVLPPPGVFAETDEYNRRRWRRVQHLVNEFWLRWRKEYLTTLQERSKWTKRSRNFQVGDIVLMKMDADRNDWPMAKVITVYPDDEGLVRQVKLMLNAGHGTETRELVRPIAKLDLLVEQSPPEKPQSRS